MSCTWTIFKFLLALFLALSSVVRHVFYKARPGSEEDEGLMELIPEEGWTSVPCTCSAIMCPCPLPFSSTKGDVHLLHKAEATDLTHGIIFYNSNMEWILTIHVRRYGSAADMSCFGGHYVVSELPFRSIVDARNRGNKTFKTTSPPESQTVPTTRGPTITPGNQIVTVFTNSLLNSTEQTAGPGDALKHSEAKTDENPGPVSEINSSEFTFFTEPYIPPASTNSNNNPANKKSNTVENEAVQDPSPLQEDPSPIIEEETAIRRTRDVSRDKTSLRTQRSAHRYERGLLKHWLIHVTNNSVGIQDYKETDTDLGAGPEWVLQEHDCVLLTEQIAYIGFQQLLGSQVYMKHLHEARQRNELVLNLTMILATTSIFLLLLILFSCLLLNSSIVYRLRQAMWCNCLDHLPAMRPMDYRLLAVATEGVEHQVTQHAPGNHPINSLGRVCLQTHKVISKIKFSERAGVLEEMV